MGIKIKKIIKKIRLKRTTVLVIVFIFLSSVLVRQLFSLQIIQGEDYISKFQTRTTKTRVIKSTRGNIYDRNGTVVASNVLAYSVTFEDSGTYNSTREKNLTLNGIAYQVLQILSKNGDSLSDNFHITVNDHGDYAFDVDEGFTLNRFRADIYGEAQIDDLSDEQKNATAAQIMDHLTGSNGFSIVLYGKDAYTPEELAAHSLPEELTKQEILEIAIMRYQLNTNSFKKYMPVTIATNVSEKSVAAIKENQAALQGIDIVEDSTRKYVDDESMAPILGYTGQASSEELETLRKDNPDYSNDAVVGKAGIEQYMELELQGKDGEETVTVDNLGKVLDIDNSKTVDPVAGNDVYLTIDSDWQKSIYQILEQRVAGIVLSKLTPNKSFDYEAEKDASKITIPIYDVYNALIANSVIDINKFSDADASDTEKNLYAKFQQKQQQVFDTISNRLTGDNPPAYKDEDTQMQEYLTYICDDLLTNTLKVLKSDSIDTADETYKAWKNDQSISLKDYLNYAASQNWIDISQISTSGEYLDSEEIYQALTAYIIDYLKTDTGFSKLLYKYMLQEDTISGEDLCLVLYEQGVLSKEDELYQTMASGGLDAYTFMYRKIANLEITPAQLALAPCSASAVITDTTTGNVLACVSYPGYDNNRIGDSAYFSQLQNDLSLPLYNNATQAKKAPGSTFKPLTAVAALEEHVIGIDDTIECTGRYEEIDTPIKCWIYPGRHGPLNMVGGLLNSCNFFFADLGHRLSMDAEGNYVPSLGLDKLHKYAAMFGLDHKSGVEIDELEPQISDIDPERSAMGQGNHAYTNVQLSRYVAAIASRGNVFELSLLDKITDSEGNLIKDYTPEISSHIDAADSTWDTVQQGMREVIASGTAKKLFADLEVPIAGKTGTAQEAKNKPNHAFFISYAPYNNPEICVTVNIPYGYSASNAANIAKSVYQYYYGEIDLESILNAGARDAANVTIRD